MILRSVGVHEVDLIERLFQETYGRKQGIEYWKWCFQNPYGYVNAGVFDVNRLVGYYSCSLTANSGCMRSAMTHPYYRKKGIYLDITRDLHHRVSLLRDYVYLFSNATIRPIHLEKEGYTEAYQVKEYRIPIEKSSRDIPFLGFNNLSIYDKWRYEKHPFVDYFIDYRGVLSSFKERMQIIDYDFTNLEKTIELAIFQGHLRNKKFVSFWSEIDLDYPSILLPLWKHYKVLNEDKITIKELLKNDELRMGMSDVY